MNPTDDEIPEDRIKQIAMVDLNAKTYPASGREGRWLAEEVLRLRKLIVDLDLWGINHKPLCNKSPWCSCACGADALQLRINEATQ